MENKPSLQGGRFLAPFSISLWSIIIVLILVSGQNSLAENLDKFYISMPTIEGNVYHTFPKDLDFNKLKSTTQGSKLKYDFTYVSRRDSVDMLMSFSSPQLIKPQAITFNEGEQYPLEIIYIDQEKSKYKYRLKCAFPYTVWEELFKNNKPISMVISAENESNLEFYCIQKKWNKLQAKFLELFKIINTLK